VKTHPIRITAALLPLVVACGGDTAADKPCPVGQACTAPVYVACFATDEVRGATRDLQPAGVAQPVGKGPIALAVNGDQLWVSHALGAAEVDEIVGGGAPAKVTVAGGDLEYLRVHQGRVYLSNASIGTVTVLDAATRAVVDEVSMAGGGSSFPNPRNIDFVGNRAYVALPGPSDTSATAAGQEIAVVDFSTTPGRIVKRISMQGLATDPGGLPFPYRLVAAGTKVYVALANLKLGTGSLSGFYTDPAGDGRLAVIDTAAGDAISLVDLGAGCKNPGGIALDGSTLWIACASGAVLPVRITVGSPVVDAAVPTPAALVPGNVAVCRGTGYVTDQFSGTVVRFDTAAKKVTGSAAICPTDATAGFTLAADVACQP
jgi:hypothetical protein